MSNRLAEFEENIKNYKFKLLANLNAITNYRNDAEDIFQRAAITMWNKYDTFAKGSNFYSWAFKIIKYELFNFGRTVKRNPVVCDDSLFTETTLSVMVDDNERNTDIFIKLEIAMSGLSDSSKKLIHAVYMEGLDIDVVAKRDGRSKRTYYNKISQIRQLLRNSINSQKL